MKSLVAFTTLCIMRLSLLGMNEFLNCTIYGVRKSLGYQDTFVHRHPLNIHNWFFFNWGGGEVKRNVDNTTDKKRVAIDLKVKSKIQ